MEFSLRRLFPDVLLLCRKKGGNYLIYRLWDYLLCGFEELKSSIMHIIVERLPQDKVESQNSIKDYSRCFSVNTGHIDIWWFPIYNAVRFMEEITSEAQNKIEYGRDRKRAYTVRHNEVLTTHTKKPVDPVRWKGQVKNPQGFQASYQAYDSCEPAAVWMI